MAIKNGHNISEHCRQTTQYNERSSFSSGLLIVALNSLKSNEKICTSLDEALQKTYGCVHSNVTVTRYVRFLLTPPLKTIVATFFET